MLNSPRVMLPLLLWCAAATAFGQAPPHGPTEPTEPDTYANPHSRMFRIYVEQGADSNLDGMQPLLDELLKKVQPDAVAADVLKLPVDKIVLVPHIFWREAKWTDWAEKADRRAVRDPKPTTGPDGKIYLYANIDLQNNDPRLEIELGPYAAASDDALYKILERIGTKMVREAPEFSRKFFHENTVKQFDRLNQRIRELSEEREKLQQQLHRGAGLSEAQLSDQIADLQRQLLATGLSLHTMKFREDAIRNQLAEMKAQTKDENNSVVATLKRIVELRKARLERLKTMKSTSAVSQEDVDKAEEEMLSSVVELDRATAAMQKGESQSQSDAMTAELRKLTIDRVEAEVRSKFLQDVYKQSAEDLTQRRDADAQDEQVRVKLKVIEGRLSQLRDLLNQSEDALNVPDREVNISLRD